MKRGVDRILYTYILIIELFIFLCNSTTTISNNNNNNNNNIKQPLYFNEYNQFKIIQFTDLHYGEGENTDWGPEQDVNSTRVMKTILEIEDQVDLIVFTGDLVTGNNVVSNATLYWEKAIQVANEFNIPWAVTFGNHDDLSSGENGSRDDLMRFDQSFTKSLSEFGPISIPGLSNYYLNIYKTSTSDKVISRVWIFDSGDGNCPDNGMFPLGSKYQCNTYITSEQIQWYLENSDSNLWSIAFFHIPLQEYMNVWSDEVCFGWNNDSVACQPTNEGLFNAFEKVGDVKVVSVGHNHGNDYCSSTSPSLCYGRHTGYGGYGTWERGARVFQLTLNPQTSSISYETWLRFETGDQLIHQPIHQPNSTNPQTQCTS